MLQRVPDACEEGDWEAMVEAAEEMHEGLSYVPCHSYDYPASEDERSNGWGGMMGW